MDVVFTYAGYEHVIGQASWHRVQLSTSTQLYTPASSCIRRIALDTYVPLAGAMATKHTHAIYSPRRRPAQLSSG